ncbi:HD domain-containing protein [Texcoconibacillus texcoconensis]|uniref:5'-deoxynucleotidase n=1 Tax=Texcoconibacillus texcoconensis TaxID=1095777 RepID=A0A840QMD6_9BACI|nr:HD domain-containing protein [Texcoconibacillus texcoconensis]MBB5172501.1 putative hydrolase of HD superfamily [Texcoconibacillus texcoconensis]
MNNLISFIKDIEKMKEQTRTAWTSSGTQETVAEHSWRLAMFLLALEEDIADFDMNKTIKMALVHDLGEVYEGDTSAKFEIDHEDKFAREEKAMLHLTEQLPKETKQRFLSLWYEYQEGETNEAKLVKALDKIETIIQHNQGALPKNFDYHFNLEYGKKHADIAPIVKRIREHVDCETRQQLK